MGIGEMRLDGQTIAEQVADQNPATKASPKSKLGHHRKFRGIAVHVNLKWTSSSIFSQIA
jgi:hypothetical protein